MPGWLVRDPQALIRRKIHAVPDVGQRLVTNQFVPGFVAHEIQVGQRKALWLGGEVVDAEHALFAIPALTPECEETLLQLQRELSGVGVEGRLLASESKQL